MLSYKPKFSANKDIYPNSTSDTLAAMAATTWFAQSALFGPVDLTTYHDSSTIRSAIHQFMSKEFHESKKNYVYAIIWYIQVGYGPAAWRSPHDAHTHYTQARENSLSTTFGSLLTKTELARSSQGETKPWVRAICTGRGGCLELISTAILVQHLATLGTERRDSRGFRNISPHSCFYDERKYFDIQWLVCTATIF